jgi:hypothetical protein
MNNEKLSSSETVATEVKTQEAGNFPVQPHKNLWNIEKLISFTAFLISIGTFITFAYQTHLIQKQQFRGVLPYLMINIHTGYDSQGKKLISLELYNNGLGPAIVEDVTFSYNGNSYATLYDFFIEGIYANNKISASRHEIKAGYALPAGQSLSLLSSNDAQAAAVLEKVFVSDDFTMEIVYASLYEEKWKINYIKGNYNPKPIKVE